MFFNFHSFIRSFTHSFLQQILFGANFTNSKGELMEMYSDIKDNLGLQTKF